LNPYLELEMFKFNAYLLCGFAALCFSTSVPVIADNAPETRIDDAKEDAVVTAYKAYETAKADYDAKYKTINEDYRAKKVSLEDARAAVAKAAEELKPSETAFTDALAKAEWKKYATDEHRPMLDTGLFMIAQEQHEAKEYAKAADTYLALLEYVPESNSGTYIRSYFLPGALVEAGKLDKALEVVKGFTTSAPEKERPALMVKYGDLLAANGDTENAIKQYQAALDAIGDGELAKNDPRARTKSDAETRKSMVGQPAPNIDSKSWVGGEAKSLADLKGHVVFLDFWATWCSPCRAAMPGIDAIYKARKDQKVIALGVTRYYKNGFLPTDSSNLSKGESVKDIKEEEYIDHVTKFKEISGLSYPFVIGGEADFTNYGIRGIPQMVIVDREGKVAMIVVGSGNDKLVETCVDNLMKKGAK
jgi:thiol-disulfide isomerase/thioredoxin